MGFLSDLKIRLKEAAYRRAKAQKGDDKRVAPGAPSLAPLFDRTLEDRLGDLASIGDGDVLAIGDGAFIQSVRAALTGAGKDNRLVPLDEAISVAGEAGTILARADLTSVAAVLAGGKRVKATWPQVLRQLYQHGIVRPDIPVLWVGEGFEWCFGSIAFPADAADADVFLFHHWAAYVGMKDHVLAHIRFFDEAKERSWTQIIAPNETIRMRLSEVLPGREGAAGVQVQTFHPRLIGRRNHRWRPWADVYTGRSLTSLHAAHEPPKPKRVAQFIVDVSRENSDRLVVTVPNYYRDLGPDTPDIAYKLCDPAGAARAEMTRDRRVGQLVSEIDVPMADAGEDVSQCRIRYQGAGGSFWYNMKDVGGIDCISANHTVSSPYDIVEATRDASYLETQALEAKDVIVWPYPVPVTPADCPVEFGFNFLCSQPEFHRYRGLLMNAAGKQIGAVAFNHSGRSHCMVSDMLAAASAEETAATAMVIVVPDWAAEQRRPDQVRVDGLMIAKCRASGDFDTTEFQNSWRNLGAVVPGFRHWLFDNMMLTGRTNLKGRLNRRPDLRNGIMLINSCGRLGYDTKARVVVQVIASNGVTLGKPVDVAPHGYALVWLDSLFPMLDEVLGETEATVLAHSADADCNGHMVTLRNGEAVSLQHMWGY